MTDIPTLISSLKGSCHQVVTSAEDVELLAVQITRENLDTVIDALSYLIAPPSEEIAGLIKELQSPVVGQYAVCEKAAATLRSLVLEVQRWKTIATDWHQEGEDKNERIRELEAERDAAILSAKNSSEAAFAWKGQRDTIRAKTLEECAHLADVMSGDVNVTGESACAVATAYQIAAAIRAKKEN